ncbi:MAG: sulfite exporter TauE/SafE family protein [bacterium]
MSALHIILLLLIGILAGLMVGVMGVGGGAPVVVLTSLLMGYPQHLAQGTALLIMIPTALVAALSHHRGGLIQWRSSLALAVGGVIGAVLGSSLALEIRGPILRYMFAAFLGIVGVRMIQVGRFKGKVMPDRRRPPRPPRPPR